MKVTQKVTTMITFSKLRLIYFNNFVRSSNLLIFVDDDVNGNFSTKIEPVGGGVSCKLEFSP